MTTPEDFGRIERLFHELSDLEPTERQRRLARIARDRPDLAAEVRRLLDHQPAGDPAPVLSRFTGDEDLIGSRIGPYRVESLLGEGGMGVVYGVRQEHPVERRVALKLVRRGADSREIVARFESERQALARMSHPNIASVFDAGTTEDGRPYFAMEWVVGAPITEYCDARRLDTRERLRLFAKVCDAVRHAHQRGVIHRDLKPSNVIVTDEAGEPEPKVIDFGVAKATEKRWTRDTAFTQLGQLVGTPEYMSPEQADPDNRDVDTRSDVYALGVLLYELLSGQLPFDVERLREAGVLEILRQIREVEPQRPSTRVRTLAGQAADAARRRRTEPRSLARILDGELDWIVMRALEKDRERRYGSVADFVEDIRSYLADRPVKAGPPSPVYRARKFARRHRVLVASAAAILVTLLVAVAGTGVALVRAIEAERVAAAERDIAERRLNLTEQVSGFLVHLFESSDPLDTPASELTVEKLLERGVERVDEELREQPAVRADVLRSLGRVYGGMGHYRKARELLERAVALRESLVDYRIENMSADLNELAIVYRRLGETEAALASHRRALELLEAREKDDNLEYATHLNGLGIIQITRDPDEARRVLEKALAIFKREGDPGELTALVNLGILLARDGDSDAAVEMLDRARVLREERDGVDSPRLAPVLNSLANVLTNLERYDEALVHYDRALALWEANVGPRHLNVARVHNNVGFLYGKQGRYDLAIPAYRRALEIKEEIYGGDHAQLVQGLLNLGHSYMESGDLAAAGAYYERGERIAREDPRTGGDTRIRSLTALAELRMRQERPGEAVALLEPAAERARELSAGDRERIDAVLALLSDALRRAGRGSEADRIDAERAGDPS